jgi:hypothetical protein
LLHLELLSSLSETYFDNKNLEIFYNSLIAILRQFSDPTMTDTIPLINIFPILRKKFYATFCPATKEETELRSHVAQRLEWWCKDLMILTLQV